MALPQLWWQYSNVKRAVRRVNLPGPRRAADEGTQANSLVAKSLPCKTGGQMLKRNRHLPFSHQLDLLFHQPPQPHDLLAYQPQGQCLGIVGLPGCLSIVWENPMTEHGLSYLQEKPAKKTSQEIRQLAAAPEVWLCEPRPISQHCAKASRCQESVFPAHSQPTASLLCKRHSDLPLPWGLAQRELPLPSYCQFTPH